MTPMADSVAQRVQQLQERIEGVLAAALPPASQSPERLHAAQRYSVLGGGKRLRPLLVYAAGECLGIPLAVLDAPAAAVELIHAYSLVHDDLPAMDDDDLRRGRPTTHRAFDEATAILAGDALQVLAFSLLAADSPHAVEPASRLKMIRILADASGTAGMAGGQALDLGAVGHQPFGQRAFGHRRGERRRHRDLRPVSITPVLKSSRGASSPRGSLHPHEISRYPR